MVNKATIALAGPANRQGRIAAKNMMGGSEKYQGTLGSRLQSILIWRSRQQGTMRKTLKRFGVPYEVLHIHPSSHAGYYPGAPR